MNVHLPMRNGGSPSKRPLSVLALIAALCMSPVVAADEPVIVSRELCNGLWIVPVTWTGESGKQHELTALFDTGGSSLYIDPDGLERASGQRVRPGKRVRMEGVSASGLAFETFRPRVRELDHLAAALGRDFDVFLPFHAFRGKLLVLDYPAREIRIEEGALPEPDGHTVFSSRGHDKRPWLEVDLAGKRRKLLIDSGSNGRLALDGLGRLEWLAEPRPVKLSATMGGEEQRLAGRVRDDVTIANLAFSQPIVSVTDDTELMGVHVLKHFVLMFDQGNRRVRFESQVEGPVRMEPDRGTGAVMRADPDGYFEVARVLPGTPAKDAGLEPGDRIVELDSVPIPERGCRKLDDPRRKRVEYGIDRNGEIRRVTLPVVDLVE